MDRHCEKCGAKLKENAKFCKNCGAEVPQAKRNYSKIIAALILAAVVIIIVVASTSMLLTPQSQTVTVDNVQFEIPLDYKNDPSRTEISYDGNVKSSAMGWSNDKHYIEIGVTRTPGNGINSREVASTLGGTPTKMFGYDGYYQKYDEKSYSFIFGIKDEVCMIYVSDYDAFDDVKVIGRR